MVQRIRRAALMAAATAAIAGPAVAVDGVFEIDQACVATGCFPGDGPGFPVEIQSQGSYRLTSDLTVPDDDTTAILIEESHVTIDLNGFSIVGQYDCFTPPPACPGGSARGIDTGIVDMIVVRNGRIVGFPGDAVRVTLRGRVESLDVERIGGNGIHINQGSIVRDNTVSFVGGHGILLGSESTPQFGLIEGNVVSFIGGASVLAGNALLLGNLLSGSTQLGVAAGYGHNRFSSPPAGGVSMGDNVCGTSPC